MKGPKNGATPVPAHVIRVGFVVSTLVTGGAERQLQHLILNMDRGKVEPHLYCMRQPGPIGEQLAAAGIPVRYGLGPGKPPAPWVPLKLAWVFRRDRIDALYCLDHTNAVVSVALASLLFRHLPILVAVHTTGQWGGKASLPRPIRVVLPRIRRLLAIAEAQKRYLIENEGIAANLIEVIRNGIPPLNPDTLPSKAEARARLGIAPGSGPVVGILAMLRPEKAHENFLLAAKLVLVRFPGAIFLVIGGGPREPELQDLARQIGIAGSVMFLGTRSDVPEILPALDLSVLASHPRVETLPLSQMEAMSLGIPVVATRVGALHELVEDGETGYLVPHGDPEALAEGIIRALSDPSWMSEAGRKARQRILTDFSVQRVARETESVLLREAGLAHSL